ncbi:PHT4 [Symbiodinium natans]|uniref:PHT4 protein n=1 Tax=Symbiodinium natans TaxID=878477 RepID=A0A812LYF3_9DINO|nr:PHT4 [Symbiodinium natans]
MASNEAPTSTRRPVSSANDAPAGTLGSRSRAQSPGSVRKVDLPMDSAGKKSSGAEESRATDPAPRCGQFRMVMCWMLFGCRLTCQANRIIFGALLPEIRQDIQLSDAEAGSLLSAFASGYMLTQILGGALADRIGGKWILQIAICAVSLGSMVAPLALQKGFWATYCTYFAAGFLEGPSFPTTGSMLSRWIPAKERSTASSLADTGGSIGGLLALGGGPILASWLGWQLTFVVYGGLSSCFCIAWLGIASSLPSSSPFMSTTELQMLISEGVVSNSHQAKGGRGDVKVQGLSWRMFFSPPVLAVCYAHAVFNFGRYFLYGWIPTFYNQVLGVPAATAAFYMTCLQVADAFVKLVVAPFADQLVASGRLSILGLRRLLSCIGFLGFGGAMGLCSLITSPALVTAALVVGKSAASCHAAGFKTNYLDISRAHTGSISGFGNTLATLSSTAAPLIAGTVIQASGWSSMFSICFAVNVSGALVFGLLSSATNLDPVLKED